MTSVTATISLTHLPDAPTISHAVWAALVAFVEDVHQPQYNLTEAHWDAVEQHIAAIPNTARSQEEHIVAIALAVMLDELDPPDLPEEEWQIAQALLDHYTRAVEGQ